MNKNFVAFIERIVFVRVSGEEMGMNYPFLFRNFGTPIPRRSTINRKLSQCRSGLVREINQRKLNLSFFCFFLLMAGGERCEFPFPCYSHVTSFPSRPLLQLSAGLV